MENFKNTPKILVESEKKMEEKERYVDLGADKYQTNESAPMLLLDKDFYSETFKALGFTELYKQYDVKDVNTGKRSILRGVLKK